MKLLKMSEEDKVLKIHGNRDVIVRNVKNMKITPTNHFLQKMDDATQDYSSLQSRFSPKDAAVMDLLDIDMVCEDAEITSGSWLRLLTDSIYANDAEKNDVNADTEKKDDITGVNEENRHDQGNVVNQANTNGMNRANGVSQSNGVVSQNTISQVEAKFKK